MSIKLGIYTRLSVVKFCILSVLLLLLLNGCADDQEEANRTESGKRNVRVAQVERKDLKTGISLTGRIESDEHLNISSAVGGRIDKIHVQVGDAVAKGDLLVEFDDSQLTQAQKSYENVKRKYERISRLYETDAVDRQSYEEIETAYAIAEANYKHLLQNVRIISPIYGRVSSISMKEGENFTPMGLPYIVRIVSLENMKATVNLPDSDYHLVKPGMLVDLNITAHPDKTFNGKVSYVSPEANIMSGTFKCEISIQDKVETFRHNQFTRVFIITDRSEQALVVPQQAIIIDNLLFVVKDGKAQKREVETGISNPQEIEIISGLQEGEQVIIVGNIGLTDMYPVNIIE